MKKFWLIFTPMASFPADRIMFQVNHRITELMYRLSSKFCLDWCRHATFRVGAGTQTRTNFEAQKVLKKYVLEAQMA